MSEDLSEFGNKTASKPKKSKGLADAPVTENQPVDDSSTEDGCKRIQWSIHGPNMWIGAGKTVSKLSSGLYEIDIFRGEPIYERKEINVDAFLRFPDSKADKVLNEIEDFWNRNHLFKKYGFLHRRGYLFYGPAGSGKTVLVQQIIKQIIDRKGIVFLCGDPDKLANGLHAFREIEPDRQVVCIFEDIDAIIEHQGEDTILSILDGENQIDKVLSIATTNYPERLDKRIVSRPRRFDRVIKIGMPGVAVREMYFKEKLKIQKSELEMWVKETEGFSFAAMAELVISVKCLGNSFEKSVDILKKMQVEKISSAESESGSVGFN
jgi:hypothetical protein